MYGNAVYKIPLAGFEKVPGKDEYNPIYRYEDAQLFVGGKSLVEDPNMFPYTYMARTTEGGGLLAMTITPAGETIRQFDKSGDLQFHFRPLQESSVNFAATDPDPQSGFFYDVNSGGSMDWIYLATPTGWPSRTSWANPRRGAQTGSTIMRA